MMAWVARKTFVGYGKRYVPGDVVKDFPHAYDRYENLIRAGYVVEKDIPAPRRTKKVAEEVKPED